MAAARKLDFMAIRFEVTKLLEPQDLAFEITEATTLPSDTVKKVDNKDDIY